ncbi:MAG: hypothetical protein QG597_3394 [Actinomycetota bacterium]|nr:hypothetical protein [Actinomycetota bacterium]
MRGGEVGIAMTSAKSIPVLAVAVVALAACGGTTTETESSTPPEPQTSAAAPSQGGSEAASGAATSDGGCTTASVSGESKNAELQALATSKYDTLICGARTSLGDQLKVINADPEFQAQVAAAGWVVNFGEALGGVSLSIVDTTDMTTCQIVVLDDLNSKGLNCGNV